jgi:preprotein translocase subunit YajC
MGSTILFILLMLGVFWFVMWRPQSKQMKAHQAMLAALKKGDEVVLLNGILGKVHEVGEKLIVLEVARDVRIRVVPSAITAKVPTGALEASGGEDGNNK